MFRLTASRTIALARPIRASPLCRFYSNKLAAASPVTRHSEGESPVVKYTDNHEWVAAFKDQTAFIGITKYAADALGETTFVEVPEVGLEVEAKDSMGSVESVKSASDLYAPVSGEVIAANEDLASSPDLVNSEPMGDAWFAQIKMTNPAELDQLMDFEAYEEFLKEDH